MSEIGGWRLSAVSGRWAVFPKVDTPYGQAPFGLEGSGASRRPGSIVRVLRAERWVRPTERAGSEGSYICRCLGQRKPYNRPGGRGNASPFGGWRHHLARWEACHWIRGSQSSPMNPVPLPPPASGGTITRAYGSATYEESVSRCFILPPEQGEVRRSPDRGWRAQRANQQNAYHAI